MRDDRLCISHIIFCKNVCYFYVLLKYCNSTPMISMKRFNASGCYYTCKH